jgi:hypothetical protein
MSKHHNTPGERRPPASLRTRNSTDNYAVLAILIGRDGAIHCTLNLIDPVANLILLAGAIKYQTWGEFFTDPATWHLVRSARRWFVKAASDTIPLTTLPPLPVSSHVH